MKLAVPVLLFALISFSVSSCKKNTTTITETVACSVNVTGFSIQQRNEDLEFTIATNTTDSIYGYTYKFQPVGNGAAPVIFKTNNKKINLKQANIPVSGGSYLISVSASCSVSDGALSTPVDFNIAPYITSPYSLSYADAATGFDWKQDMTPTEMQVQYAEEGFILGTGRIETVTTKPYKNAKLNKLRYDFYVRIGSGNNVWSKWVGPLNYTSTTTQNICNVVYNLHYSYQFTTPGEYNGVIIDFHRDGETHFEHALVPSGASLFAATIKTLQIVNPTGPGAGLYYDIQKGVGYKLYIRTVCANGDKTAWNYISF